MNTGIARTPQKTACMYNGSTGLYARPLSNTIYDLLDAVHLGKIKAGLNVQDALAEAAKTARPDPRMLLYRGLSETASVEVFRTRQLAFPEFDSLLWYLAAILLNQLERKRELGDAGLRMDGVPNATFTDTKIVALTFDEIWNMEFSNKHLQFPIGTLVLSR